MNATETRASTPLTAILSEFITGIDYGQFERKVLECARERIIDQLGVQMIGSTMPWSRLVSEYVRHYGGLQESTVVGNDFSVPSFEAGFANATFGHSCELDDYGGGAHSGVSTIPAAFALAEANRCKGAAVMRAVIVGYEVINCLSTLFHVGLGKRGFHTLGVVGVFGATAAAASILKLDERQTLHALAVAGSFAGTTMEYDQTGGEAKRIHAGLVARAGIQAATLAQRGLTGPTGMIDGHRGIGRLFADFNGDTAPAVANLGRDFAILNVNTKVHPVLARVAAALDAATLLTKGEPLSANAIASVDVAVNEGTLKHGGSIRKPKDALSAQMSLPFALAMQLVVGRNDLADYLDPAMRENAEILAVAEKVKLQTDPEAVGKLTFSCRLRLKLTSGEELYHVQPYPKGAAGNPLSREEVLGKFRRLARTVLHGEQIEQLIGNLNQLENLDDVSGMMQLMRKAS